jgi:hypothetical protein
MLGRLDLLPGERLARLHRRQPAGLVVLVVVAPLLVEREEAVEPHDLAGRAEVEAAGAGGGENVDAGALEFGALHLAGDGAGPDQLVELGLVAFEMAGDVARPARQVGRPDRLVRFLGVLGLDDVFARRGAHDADRPATL